MYLYLVALAWLYVALLMAVAEATSPVGSVLGAFITFLLYGLGPVALVMYILGTPARKRRLKAREPGPVNTNFTRCVADQKGHAQGAKTPPE